MEALDFLVNNSQGISLANSPDRCIMVFYLTSTHKISPQYIHPELTNFTI